jgi:hypothetical protein
VPGRIDKDAKVLNQISEASRRWPEAGLPRPSPGSTALARVALIEVFSLWGRGHKRGISVVYAICGDWNG